MNAQNDQPHSGHNYMKLTHQEQITDNEALGPEERADMMDPTIGDGTPETAPECPPSATRLERAREKLASLAGRGGDQT